MIPALEPSDRGAKAASEHGLERSPHWPHVRAEQLRRQPVCQATGLTTANGAELEAHHIYPFHFCVLVGRADLELDLRNLITLARHPIDAHLLIGHLDDFRSSNLDVIPDCVTWHAKDDTVIRADATWLAKRNARMKPWSLWTDDQKKEFRNKLDVVFIPAVVVLPYVAR